MNLDDIKDQLSEKLTAAWGELQENSTFNTLREKYQTLSANGQKALQATGALLVVLLLIYIPYSFFSASSTHVADFEENRQMIRSLLAASRNAKLPPPLPPAQGTGQMQSQVQMMLESFQLMPEQIGEMNPLPPNPAGALVSPAIEQAGISVQLKNLNLTQIVEIGQRMQNMGAGTKMLGFEMNASADKKNYFDVIYKIVNFSLTIKSEPEEQETTRPGRRRPMRGGGDE